jgi:predicted nucleotide-binding protein (sugar kinase/HSP70/actin superfamily)
MKITFPHMGNMYVTAKVLLDTIGIDYVMPPFCNKEIMEKGVKDSPEFICLPFKAILGEFIYGIENGADFILFGGGCGQCRLGYYGDLQDEILKSIGKKTEFVCFDLSQMTVKDTLKNLKPILKGKSPLNIFKGILYSLLVPFKVDKLYKLACYTRCREINKGDTDNIMLKFHSSMKTTKGYKSINKLIRSSMQQLNNLEIDRNIKPLRIAIVGEIFAALEPYINLDIERKLGNLGIEVDNKLYLSNWIREHVLKKLIPIKLKNKAHTAGKEFMRTDDIGGHGLETIGNIILCGKSNYDGVIHLYPFTCMPEIIAVSTFNEIQHKYGIPVMTLILDEMTGEVGYMTRIEAFVDMCYRKSKFADMELNKPAAE